MHKKACKKCRLFVEGDVCPICKGNIFTDNFKGRVYVVDANQSIIAKKVGFSIKGEYAIKIR